MRASRHRKTGYFPTFLSSFPRIWLISIGFLLCLSFGLWWYWNTRSSLNIDNILPGEPVLVWKGKLPSEVDQVSESFHAWVFERLSSPSLQSVAGLQGLLSLSGLNQDLWKEQFLTLALYQVSSRDLEVLGLIQCTKQKRKEWRKIIDDMAQKMGPAYRKRRILDINIEEFQIGNQSYSLFFYQDFILGSFSPFLLEDVIRRIKGDKIAASPQNGQLKQLPQTSPGHSEIFINHQALSEVLPLVLEEDHGQFFSPYLYWASQSMYQEMPSAEGSSLQGWGFPTSSKNSTLFPSLHQQGARPFGGASWIPQNASSFLSLSYQNASQVFSPMSKSLAFQKTPWFQNQEHLRTAYGFAWESFWADLKDGLHLCFLESRQNFIQDKVLILQSQSTKNQIFRLQQLARNLLKDKNIRPNTLQVGGLPVYHLPQEEFPASFMGSMALGFPETYFTSLDSCLIITNNLRVMRNYLNHIRDKRVWKYSKNHQVLLESLREPAHWRFVMDAGKSWGDLQSYLANAWEDPINQLSYFFLNKYVLIQGQQKSDFIQSRISYFPKSKSANSITKPAGLQKRWSIGLGERLFTGPVLMKNHSNAESEVFIQDFKNQLYLLNDQGKLIWKKDAGAPVRSHPQQIDIYRNNKLQYLFITPDRISLIDRLGRYVPKFPFYSPDSTYFQTLAYLDAWDMNKHYFLSSDKKGNLYMYDEAREKVAGWRPLRLRAPLASAVQSLRIDKEVHFIICQENGLIRLFNQDALPLAGFPLDLKEPLSNPLWVQEGIDLSSSKAFCISDGGRLIEFNLIGEELNSRQIPRLSEYSKFFLCPSQENNQWIIARHDGAEVALFDSQGDLLFEKTLPGISAKVIVQYFNLQNGRNLVVVTDKIGSRSYLYDIKGNPVSPPIRSNQAVDVQQNPQTNQVFLYVAYSRELSQYELIIR